MYSRAILKLLVKRFRQQWPHVKIIFRGDSGFCRWRLMRWCDRNNVGYITGIARNPVLEGLAQQWTYESTKHFEQTGQKQRIFGEFAYAADTWDCRRRVIVKAEHLEQGANTRFIVTNLEGEPQKLYDEVYCQRGETENRIKEQQWRKPSLTGLGLFADRTSCHDFVARRKASLSGNQFRVLLSGAAYILMDTLRRKCLADSELANAQVGTIRLKLLKIGARVVHSVRRIVIHSAWGCLTALAGGYPFKQLFVQVLSRMSGLGVTRLSFGFG